MEADMAFSRKNSEGLDLCVFLPRFHASSQIGYKCRCSMLHVAAAMLRSMI
jgi:hypothetical protein